MKAEVMEEEKSGFIKSVVYETHIPVTNDNKKKHVAVLMGGMSKERDVSLSSAKGVIEALKTLGYKVTPIDVGNDLASVLVEVKPDVVFNALHGTYGEDGTIPGVLDLLQIPYTHAGVLGSAIAFNKEKTREIAIFHGVQVAKGFILNKKDAKDQDPLPRPYVAKPIAEGSSVGVEIYFPEDNAQFKDYNWLGYSKILVEEYIAGREIQVAIVGDKAVGAIEIIPKGRYLDYDGKYVKGASIRVMPAPIPEAAYKKVLEIAEKVHNALELRTMSRVDFRYDDTKGGEGEFYLLEANSHPGFTPTSFLPEIAKHVGFTYEDLVEILLKGAKWGA